MRNLQRTCQDVATARRRELLPLIYYYTGGRVITGPFEGSVICPYYMWGDGDTAAKLLGVYEDELHTHIYRAQELKPDLVVNVGCAEGYYAIGAKKLTGAETIAVDIEPRALEICKVNATASGVEIDRYLGSVAPADLEALIKGYERPWLLLDCEGYEEDLLNRELTPGLDRCMILAETHDVFRAGLTARLAERFQDTHNIVQIDQATKDPYKFAFLRNLSDTDKFALVHEGRPVTGSWLWMEPK